MTSSTIQPPKDIVVSVLVTAYNRERYLAATLESILASTFGDFEVLVVDDASSDRSIEVAREFAARDERVRVHSNGANLGDYPNRARAASLARGRYLKYVDSDDLIYPHSLEIMVQAMEERPEVGLGLAHSLPEDEAPYPWRLSSEAAYRKHFLGRGCLSCGPTGAIIRRSAFDAVDGFRPSRGVLADIDLWLRLAAYFPVVLLPPGLVWWRRHDSQEFSRERSAAEYLRGGYELASEVLKRPTCPLSERERLAALGRARQHFARRLLSLAFRSLQPARALGIFAASDLSLVDLVGGLRSYR